MSIKVSHSSTCLINNSKFLHKHDYKVIQEIEEDEATLVQYMGEGSEVWPPINISILGKQSVGKTALIVRYLTGKFIGEYESDTDTIYKFDFKLAGSTFPVAIKDYKIGEEFLCLKEIVVSNGFVTPPTFVTENFTEISQMKIDKLVSNEDAFVLVYDVSDRRSFDYVRVLAYRILSSQEYNTTKRILIVGNKTDLEHLRNVSRKEGELLSKSTQLGIFEETSALEWEGHVPDAFHKLLFVIGSARFQNNNTEKPKSDKMFSKGIKRRSQSFKHLSWGSNNSEGNGMFFVQPNGASNNNNNNKEKLSRKLSLQERRKKVPNLLTVPSFDYCSSGGSQNTSPAFPSSTRTDSSEKDDNKNMRFAMECYSAPYNLNKCDGKCVFDFPEVADKRSKFLYPQTPIPGTDSSPKGFFNQLKGNFRRKKSTKTPPSALKLSPISQVDLANKFHRSQSAAALTLEGNCYFPSNESIDFSSSFDGVTCLTHNKRTSFSTNSMKKSPLGGEKDNVSLKSKARFGSKLVKHRERLKSMLPSSKTTS